MKIDGNAKQEHILEAAIRRFSHFGIGKTTLTEIAEDLAISKPLLFYYFQDKNSLIDAVVEKIVAEFLAEFQAAIEQAVTVEEGLLSVVEIKRAYFKKYFLLAMQGENIAFNTLSPSLQTIYLNGKEKSQQFIAALLRKAKAQRTIAAIDEVRVSELLMETLSAFEFSLRARRSIPEAKDINEMFDKQRELVKMIVNGLKYSCCTH